jgi:hypothetical protein
VEGEPGELLVLCRNDTFTNFKVRTWGACQQAE